MTAVILANPPLNGTNVFTVYPGLLSTISSLLTCRYIAALTNFVSNPVLVFNSGDWDWCPVYQNTERQHICQKSITPLQVFNSLPL